MNNDTITLLLLETSGKQKYVFASNKTKEIVGASQLILDATTTWLDDALSGETTGWHEVLTRISGLASVVFQSHEDAVAVAQAVTLRALKEAPGLELDAGTAALGSWPSDDDMLAEAVHCASRAMGDARAKRCGQAVRMLRLPIVADCATTTFPAATVDTQAPEVAAGQRPPVRSAVAVAKRVAADRAKDRLIALGRKNELLARASLRALELAIDERAAYGDEDSGWIAVVHADANGIGDQVRRIMSSGHDRGKHLRRFSEELDAASISAYCEALEVASGDDDERLVVPILLGGDDLTAIVLGGDVIEFVRTYLTAFEDHTRAVDDSIIDGHLTAGAGVAVVKRHYPFSSAYSLAEELATSAKRHGKRDEDPHQWRSSLDFHVNYDGTTQTLKALREPLQRDDGRLLARPYTIDELQPLRDALDALRARVDGRRVISRSQVNQLRHVLVSGTVSDAARDARLRLRRHPDLAGLIPDEGLFRDGVTYVLDAIDADEIWSPEAWSRAGRAAATR